MSHTSKKSTKTSKKSTAKKADKPSEPASIIFVSPVGPEALSLCRQLAETWNKSCTKENERSPIGPEEILEEALSHGLHALAHQELGSPDAWDEDHIVCDGASTAALMLSGRLRRAAGEELSRGRSEGAEGAPGFDFAGRAQKAIRLASLLDDMARGTILAKLEIALEKQLIRVATEMLESRAAAAPAAEEAAQ